MCVSPSGAESNQPRPKKQLIPCRLCGQPIEVDPWIFNGKDLSMVTCANNECGLKDYTFTARHYPTVDLTLYLKGQRDEE